MLNIALMCNIINSFKFYALFIAINIIASLIFCANDNLGNYSISLKKISVAQWEKDRIKIMFRQFARQLRNWFLFIKHIIYPPYNWPPLPPSHSTPFGFWAQKLNMLKIHLSMKTVNVSNDNTLEKKLKKISLLC